MSLPVTGNTEYSKSRSGIIALLSTYRQTQLTQPRGLVRPKTSRFSDSLFLHSPVPLPCAATYFEVSDELGVYIPISSHSSWPEANKTLKNKISFLLLSPGFCSWTAPELYSVYQRTSHISIYHCNF